MNDPTLKTSLRLLRSVSPPYCSYHSYENRNTCMKLWFPQQPVSLQSFMKYGLRIYGIEGGLGYPNSYSHTAVFMALKGGWGAQTATHTQQCLWHWRGFGVHKQLLTHSSVYGIEGGLGYTNSYSHTAVFMALKGGWGTQTDTHTQQCLWHWRGVGVHKQILTHSSVYGIKKLWKVQ